MPGFIDMVIPLAVVAFLISTLVFPKKLRFFIASAILLSVGLVGILYENWIVTFRLDKLALVNFAVSFMIIIAGKEHLMESFREKSNPLRVPSLILALALILLTTMPTLHSMGIIDFMLPDYPSVINSYLYVVCGIFLFLGIFLLPNEEKKVSYKNIIPKKNKRKG
ncbi:MAG TPA: hypothetical protein ENN46_02980 [Candidatus Woesearchaeota archaeon]|nr:hypothetical protein [Candidatus Woesearchaeota archaeon]